MRSTLTNWKTKIKSWLNESDWPFILIIGLAASLIFGSWQLVEVMSQKEPVKLIGLDNKTGGGESEAKNAGLVVASKNSQKYHYPWCSGAKRIKPENQVWFDSIAAARAAGLTPAANCPGLE